jgi:hypothetical protein
MKSEIAWRTDKHGMLLGAPMHDGDLVKFMMTKESLEFGIRAVSGEFVSVELTGLGRFTVRELWSYPIVSEFWVWRVGSVPESWDVPDSSWNVLFSTSNDGLTISEAKREATKIVESRPNSFLVELSCSYGGRVVAICDRICVFKNGPQTTAPDLK